MKTLKQLKEERFSFVSIAENLVNLCAAEDNRIFSEDEQLKYDAALQSAESLTVEVEATEKQIKQQNKLDDMKALLNKDVATNIKQNKYKARITTEVDWKNDPMCGYNQAGEFYLDVYKASRGQASEKLRYLQTAGSDEMSGISDPYGGFLIPKGMSADLLKRDTEADPSIGRMREISMDRPEFTINARVDANHTTSVSGGTTVSRRIQTQAIPSSRGQYEQIKLYANSLAGLAYASNEQIHDSPRAVSQILSEAYAEESRAVKFDEKIWGTGAGQPEGIMNSDALVSVTRSTASTDDIEMTDIVTMRSRVWGYGNAIWLANHDTLPWLANLTSADSANIWLPSAREDVPNVLMGRPLFFTEFAQTTGTTGDLICVNWREYLYGNYQPVQNASSVEVRFVENESAFRWTERNDGRSWWTSAFTPKYSSTTLSPFVCLTTE